MIERMAQLDNRALQNEIAGRKRVFAFDQMGADMDRKNTIRFAWQPYVATTAVIAAAVTLQPRKLAALLTQSSEGVPREWRPK